MDKIVLIPQPWWTASKTTWRWWSGRRKSAPSG